jgi:hypothetical protein
LVKIVFLDNVAIAFIRLDPSNVIADGEYLPALKPGRWDHHGEVCFSASAGESGCYIGLLALWVFSAEDQHVLGHPALVSRYVRCDPQGEAFLSEQRIAPVAGAV